MGLLFNDRMVESWCPVLAGNQGTGSVGGEQERAQCRLGWFDVGLLRALEEAAVRGKGAEKHRCLAWQLG
jgi:hypothetical protein